ncbi:unnamed protein product [Camellia sinensis]
MIYEFDQSSVAPIDLAVRLRRRPSSPFLIHLGIFFQLISVKVTIDVEQNCISVYNNGDGVPVEIHQEEGVYVPEMIFGHLLTSSNYDDLTKKTTGGRNGYGAKLTNIFSTEFVIETADRKWQKKYKQELAYLLEEKNMSLAAIQVAHESEINNLGLELEKERDKLANIQLKLQEELKLNKSFQEELSLSKVDKDKGDYVDRGQHSLETITLLLSLKVKEKREKLEKLKTTFVRRASEFLKNYFASLVDFMINDKSYFSQAREFVNELQASTKASRNPTMWPEASTGASLSANNADTSTVSEVCCQCKTGKNSAELVALNESLQELLDGIQVGASDGCQDGNKVSGQLHRYEHLSRMAAIDESESLSDIDDVEVDKYLHSKEEMHYKKIIWEQMNSKHETSQGAENANTEGIIAKCDTKFNKKFSTDRLSLK